MSAKHLAKGSAQPPKVEGKLRLYSMQFCPFSQRVRLVLLAKGLPHDIVNVHLKNKPDWIFDVHPEGKVPTLDTGSQVVVESLDICDFLEEQYPESPLYPKDPQKREQDKTIIKNFNDVITLFIAAAENAEKLPFSEHLERMSPHLKKLESELENRGVYFGGNKPNMVDYMLWPLAERAEALGLIFEQELPGPSVFPHICTWCKAMRTQKPVQLTETSPERMYKLHMQYMARSTVDYDNI